MVFCFLKAYFLLFLQTRVVFLRFISLNLDLLISLFLVGTKEPSSSFSTSFDADVDHIIASKKADSDEIELTFKDGSKSTDSDAPKRPRAIVWKYFNILPHDYAECKICYKPVVRKSTSSLRQHLQRSHDIILSNVNQRSGGKWENCVLKKSP